MTPLRIIKKAIEKGMDIIAISDHNSAENLVTAVDVAGKNGISLFPGIEITSSEEAHVLALFETAADALAMQEKIYRGLPEGANDERMWGEQVIVNAHDEVMGFNTRLLIGATKMTLKEIVREIHALGGLAVASHIDRESFSVISQLGFIPEDVEFDALEIVNPKNKSLGRTGMAMLCSSDAHRLEDIGKRNTRLLMEGPTFSELRMALKSENGRKCLED